MIVRREEKYICPGEKGWERRYNKGVEEVGEYKKMLCWVLEYYIRGVKDKKKKSISQIGLLKREIPLLKDELLKDELLKEELLKEELLKDELLKDELLHLFTFQTPILYNKTNNLIIF